MFRAVVLCEILVALGTPENATKIAEAKENCGNEMMKMMQFVYPIVTQIQMDVIKNYGFTEGREGYNIHEKQHFFTKQRRRMINQQSYFTRYNSICKVHKNTGKG